MFPWWRVSRSRPKRKKASLPESAAERVPPPDSRLRRSLFLSLLFALLFVILGVRAFYLQAIDNTFLFEKGNERSSHILAIPAYRGRILDRNGHVLAISTPMFSVWASDSFLSRHPLSIDQEKRLSALLNMSLEALHKKLMGTEFFVYLKRQIPPYLAKKIVDLHIQGIDVTKELKRFYPARESAAQLIGTTNIDGVGQEGAELSFEDKLRSVPGARRVVRDRHGHVVDDVGSVRRPQQGTDVSLSIDASLQDFAYRRLLQALQRTQAKTGSAIVVDIHTGEVLAMVNVPSFNPNVSYRFISANRRNRVMTDAYEPGSVMKPLVMALALQDHHVNPETRIETAPGYLYFGQQRISDPHKMGLLTATQVIQKSSNVGISKIALGFSAHRLWQLYHQLGFGHALSFELPGQSEGLLLPAHKWLPIEQATMAYGQGISVTMLQLAHAYTVLARPHGDSIPLTILKQSPDYQAPIQQRIFRPEVVKQVRQMLTTVVEKGGTAPLAAIPGYMVGGKTGTAYKVLNGRYVHQYWSTFAGIVPIDHPRVVVIVAMNAPEGILHYGGQVAAPVFHDIAENLLRLWRLQPDVSALESRHAH